MNVSFDGVRRRLVDEFNTLVGYISDKNQTLDAEQTMTWNKMRDTLWALLCMYDPEIENDCTDLSGEVELNEIPDANE